MTSSSVRGWCAARDYYIDCSTKCENIFLKMKEKIKTFFQVNESWENILTHTTRNAIGSYSGWMWIIPNEL